MERVARNHDPGEYTRVGQAAARTMLTAATAAAGCPVTSVLDWGCGPGRLTAHLLSGRHGIAVRGCDIDAEAVTWAAGNLGPVFDVTGTYPPLPYGDCSFSAIIACSVMTHLDRITQRKWLAELGRILLPGGVLVATVHGPAAARALGISEIHGGIDDHWLDTALHGIAPGGYYRTVLQTQAYTRGAWQWGGFEVTGYQETAVELQDMVICTR